MAKRTANLANLQQYWSRNPIIQRLLRHIINRVQRGENPRGTHYFGDPTKRTESMLAYAYSYTTGRLYVGYSGWAGIAYSPPTIEWEDDYGLTALQIAAIRRAGNLKALIALNLDEKRKVKWTKIFNCAEANAYGLAAYHGESLKDLLFIAVDSKGIVRPPCDNCMTWITDARGYVADRGEFELVALEGYEKYRGGLKIATLDMI